MNGNTTRRAIVVWAAAVLFWVANAMSLAFAAWAEIAVLTLVLLIVVDLGNVGNIRHLVDLLSQTVFATLFTLLFTGWVSNVPSLGLLQAGAVLAGVATGLFLSQYLMPSFASDKTPASQPHLRVA